MPDDKVENQPEEKKEEQPSYITREELTRAHETLVAKIEGLTQGFTASRSEAATEVPPQRQTISLDEIDEAVTEGKGAAGKIDRLIEARVQQRLEEAMKEHVTPLRNVGLSNLEALAKSSALTSLKHAKRYEKEIEQVMRGVDPAARGNIEAWQKAYAMVIGSHYDDLAREEREQAIRAEASRTPAPGPSAKPGVYTDEDGGELEPLDKAFGPQYEEILRAKGIDYETFAKKLGYKNGAEYLKVKKFIDGYEGDLI